MLLVEWCAARLQGLRRYLIVIDHDVNVAPKWQLLVDMAARVQEGLRTTTVVAT
jgi:hypothetical protein